MGLDRRKQEVSWDESQSKKKKKKGPNKEAADRYYSAVNRQLLKSGAPVSIVPTNSECSGATGSFLPLTDNEENTKAQPGRRFSHKRLCSINQSRGYLFSVAVIMWLIFKSTCLFHLGGDVQSTAVNPLGVYDSSTALWLQGKGKQMHAEQENLDMTSEPSATLSTGRTEEFNRQLREQPTNAQLWIKFIKFQVSLFLPGK